VGAIDLSSFIWPDVAQGRQPQSALPIDWSSPINDGLVFAFEPAYGQRNAVFGEPGEALGTGVTQGTGPYGRQLNFSGSQGNRACSFGQLSGLKGATQATWDILVYFNATNVNSHFFGQWDGTSNQWLLQANGAGGLIWVAADDGLGNRARFDSATSPLNAVGWYRIICSWRGNFAGGQTILVNGNVNTNSTAYGTAAIGNGPNYLQLGTVNGGSALPGSVAFARAWKRGKSLAEMKALNDAMWLPMAPPIPLNVIASGGGPAAIAGNANASPASAGALTTSILVASAGASTTAESAALTTAIATAASKAATTASSAAISTSIAIATVATATTGKTAALSTSIPVTASRSASTSSAAGLGSSAAAIAANQSASTGSSAAVTTAIRTAASQSAQTGSAAALGAVQAAIAASATASTATSAALTTGISATAAASATTQTSSALSTAIRVASGASASTGSNAALAGAVSAAIAATNAAATAYAAAITTQIIAASTGSASPSSGASISGYMVVPGDIALDDYALCDISTNDLLPWSIAARDSSPWSIRVSDIG